MSEELLSYYNKELAYIRQLGDDFSKTYPKIAGRLRLNATASDDPHVERLIQAFAFLTARIRKKLDDDFPEIAESLLEILHPHYLSPIPSMTVVQFVLSETAGKLTSGYSIPRHSTLVSEPVGGNSARFRSSYPVTLWPVRLASASISGPPFAAPQTPALKDAKCVLRLRLECYDREIPLKQLSLESIRFFLNGQRQYIHELYEMLINNALGIAVANGPDDPEPHILDSSFIQQVGFGQNEELLPHSTRTPRSYQLLREYFAFPEKFLFIDFAGLDTALENWAHPHAELFVYINRRLEHLEPYVSTQTFQLGCTPVVNLFQNTAEPIRLTQKDTRYQIIPDARREMATEVFSVDAVNVTDTEGIMEVVAPLYSNRHADQPSSERKYWFTDRQQGRRREDQPDTGTDVYISMVDLEFDPQAAADHVLTIQTTCLNRDLPSRLPFGGGRPKLELEQGGPIGRIDALMPPSPTRRPGLHHAALWRLISHLSLNHLSINGGDEGARTLREMLKVYDIVRPPDDPFPFDGILSIDSRRIVSRIGVGTEIQSVTGSRVVETGFARGTEIELELDEERFIGTGLFLFASVLERFFALYTSVNSFTALVLKTKQRKEVCRWPPRTGAKVLR